MRDTASSVGGRPKFEIDFRVEGVFQDAIFKRRFKNKIHLRSTETLEYVEIRCSCTKSSLVIHEMGNMELFELGQISETVIQCHSCLKHQPQGLKFCGCDVCL